MDAVVRPESESNTVRLRWPASVAVGDADAMAVVRTLVVPMALSFAPGD